MKMLPSLLFPLVFLTTGSGQEDPTAAPSADWEAIQSTWAGAAELSHYDLTQMRYGEKREGSAVLIFVREPFLKDKQVKDESGPGNYQVLKMNSLRTFLTGVYPYRTMVSVFQPLQKGSAGTALKVTASVQEWCGHVFMQSNRYDKTIRTDVNSYFEKEEGRSFEVNGSVWLEDEVWTGLRVDPAGLPVGTAVQMVPGSLATRLSHFAPLVQTAQTRWLKGANDQTKIYQITYPETGRQLAIEIEAALPFGIQSWRESNRNGLISEGKLVKRVNNVDYWNFKDEAKGKKLRKKLGLKS